MMATFWIIFVVASIAMAELLRPRRQLYGPPSRAGDRIRTGLFTWTTLQIDPADFRCPRTTREQEQFEETGELYAGQNLDEANPWRGPRAEW